MKTLLIDDIRDLQADLIARTYEMGESALTHLGPWENLKLDHDLGEGGTGYDILTYLERHPDLRPKHVELVTGNPVGRDRMKAALSQMGYTSDLSGLYWSCSV